MSISTDAGAGGLCTRRGCRALIAPWGLGDNSVQVCDRLAVKQSCSLFFIIARSAARNDCESVTEAPLRVRNSLAVTLPYVKFVGALCAPENGTKARERSFSGANWL